MLMGERGNCETIDFETFYSCEIPECDSKAIL